MFDYERLKFFLVSPRATVLAFLWGFSEATFFFVVPDVFFGFTALFIPLSGLMHGIVSILGSMVGGIVMYKLASVYPVALENFLNQIPGINGQMISQVYINLNTVGLKSLFVAPLSGVPYKIYAVEAAILQIDFTKFILMTFPSRLVRIFLVSFLAAAIGKIFHKSIKNNAKAWGVFYVALWVVFYVVYICFITKRY